MNDKEIAVIGLVVLLGFYLMTKPKSRPGTNLPNQDPTTTTGNTDTTTPGGQAAQIIGAIGTATGDVIGAINGGS